MSRIFTLEELHSFNGAQDDQPIYIALNGKVYDVSSGRHFYGPGTSYHALAGHDASVALAKSSLEAQDIDAPLSSLQDPEDRERLQNWVNKYDSKYPVVGTLVCYNNL
jgi:membrane-associated progesterone receptor component